MAHTRTIPAFLSFYLLFAIGLISKVLGDVQWEQPSVQAMQGDDVTVTCSIPNYDFFDVVRMTKESYQGVNTIADKEIVKKPFSDTKRYNVSFKEDSNTGIATMSLTYKGIRGEDAGTIKCEILGRGTPAKLKLEVTVPIDGLYIIQKEGDQEREIGEQEEITLVEGKENGVKCRATVDGSLDSPLVTVTIAGEDQTSLFTMDKGSDIIDPNGGLGINTANTNVTYVTTNPNPDFNGKTLTCRAETENGKEEETASTVLNVQYKPRVTCDKYNHFGIVGESISIKCAVRSNPPSKLVWQWQQNKKTVELNEQEDSVEAEEEEITDDEIKATLIISDIQANHFTNYILTATNEIGPKTITVGLTQGSPPKHHNNHPNDQASQPNNPEVATSPPLATTTRPGMEVPQGVSGRGSKGPSASWAASLGLMATVVYYVMGQR